jgi:ubiquinone/menaquinone biosynthesis C-methylase UbiE
MTQNGPIAHSVTGIEDTLDELAEGRDPKKIVADGYNQIADGHLAWARRTRTEERARYASVLLDRLSPGARVLELGCGAGIPTTRQLAARFSVTGVDISHEQLARAWQNVPGASFVLADMTEIRFAPGSFDAVAAFYALIHVPRGEQPGLLHRIARWLSPGGLLAVTMGARATEAEFEPDWLGAPMYWSSYDSDTNRRLVEKAGLCIISAREETAEEFGQPVTFLWIVAEKPVCPQKTPRGN